MHRRAPASLTRSVVQATLHCLTVYAIGEIGGMVTTTALVEQRRLDRRLTFFGNWNCFGLIGCMCVCDRRGQLRLAASCRR